MDFGFTNDPSKIAAIRQFRDDAVADGWSIRPTYGDGRVLIRPPSVLISGPGCPNFPNEVAGFPPTTIQLASNHAERDRSRLWERTFGFQREWAPC